MSSSGGSAICLRKFDAEAALRTVMAQQVTHSQWVPTMFHRLLRLPQAVRDSYYAPSHRLAWHTAAPCPMPVKRAMIAWWGPILMEYYAGSESVGMTALDSHQWLAHPGSVGRGAACRTSSTMTGTNCPPASPAESFFPGCPAWTT